MLKGAYAMIRAAEQDEARIRQQVRAGVARSYYGLYAARRAKALSEQSLATALHHQELTRRQIAAGTLADRARYQSDLAVAQAKRDLARANEQVDVAELAFHQTTGLPQDSGVSLPPTASVAASVDEALRVAMDARPDLKAAPTQLSCTAVLAEVHNPPGKLEYRRYAEVRRIRLLAKGTWPPQGLGKLVKLERACVPPLSRGAVKPLPPERLLRCLGLPLGAS